MNWDLLLYLLVLLLSAKFFGGLFLRGGFSPLIGEVAIGVLLGPAGYGLITIEPGETISDGITAVAMLGLVVMMLVAGLNSRFEHFMRIKYRALVIALCGMSVSFALGFGIAYAWGYQMLACVFVGAALSNTATEVVTRVVGKSRHSQLIVSAALIDDIMAVYVLGLLSSAVLRGGLDWSVFAWTTLGIFVFFVLVTYLSRKLIIEMNLMQKLWRFEKGEVPITFVVCLALALAVATHYIGLHAIIGAYMAGMFISRLRERPDALLLSRIQLNAILDNVTTSLQSILTPMFFVFVGLNFPALGEIGWGMVPLLLALLAAAFVGKMVGCGAGAAVSGYRGRDIAIIGTAMCSRGSLEIAVLLFGLESEILPSALFATMIAVTLATTLLTPIFFKLVSKEGTG